jgi:signal recognition particle subunit SEC65
MFNKEDEYLNATRDAQLYKAISTKSSNNKLMILNIFLLFLLGFATFIYLQHNTNIFSSSSLSSLPLSEQAVLGVSETVDDFDISNKELMKILNSAEIDALKENEQKYSQLDLQNSMKILINESSIRSKSSYTDAIVRELEDKSSFIE